MEAAKTIHQFVDQASGSDSVENLVPLLETACKELGFNFFSYLLVKPREWLVGQIDSPMSVSNYPQPWIKRYLDQNYYINDPTIIAASKDCRPVRWGPERWDKDKILSDISSTQRLIIEEASTFGIKRGLTIPINGPDDELGLFTVASDQSAEKLDQAICHNSHTLHVIITYAHALIVKQNAQKTSPQEFDLTVRQKEVLFWTAQGKSSWEISKIIDRSIATVNFHIKHAIRKLNASNKTHAAVKATVFQLIDPYAAQLNQIRY